MKFANIKVGDFVYMQGKVQYGWGLDRVFFIKTPVIKVTEKRFLIKDGRAFNKENGHEHGGRTCVYKIGDKVGYSDSLVFDQTEDLEKFKKSVQDYYKINDLTKNLDANDLYEKPEATEKLFEALGELNRGKKK